MRRILSLLLLAVITLAASAQSISVASFHLDETDATANMPGSTVTDRNGNKCALIKIETTKTGFAFDVGSQGVQDTRQKTGQIWVYVPAGIKHITITHPKYAPCNYTFEIAIEKARTYIMPLVLTEDMLTQRLEITFSPASAIVLLDDELVETNQGRASLEILQGVHKYNVLAPGYTPQAGTVVLKGNYTYRLPIDLSSNPKRIAAVDRYRPVQALSDLQVEEEEDTLLTPVKYKVGDVPFVMIPVRGGTFMMGATPEQENPEEDEMPTHLVSLNNFYIAETEVTQELWKAVMGDNPSDPRMIGDQQPVENVSWDMCQQFITRLNEISNMRFRLPTEAEWEYAARGGVKSNNTQFSGGTALHMVGWGSDNSNTVTHDVKGKQPNELGIYDMCGNVAEWCQDWKGTYPSTPQISPEGPESGQRRVIRGGSWNSYSESECRVTSRSGNLPVAKKNNVGFRIVLQ